MPNTAVKPANAESTWGEAPWEDRKPLILIKKALAYASAFLLPVYPVEPAKPAKYNPPAMRVRGVSYTKKITFPV